MSESQTILDKCLGTAMFSVDSGTSEKQTVVGETWYDSYICNFGLWEFIDLWGYSPPNFTIVRLTSKFDNQWNE